MATKQKSPLPPDTIKLAITPAFLRQVHRLLREARKQYKITTPQSDALRELEAACEMAVAILE